MGSAVNNRHRLHKAFRVDRMGTYKMKKAEDRNRYDVEIRCRCGWIIVAPLEHLETLVTAYLKHLPSVVRMARYAAGG